LRIGFKDVDDCVGIKNPIPFSKMDTDFNPIYVILCIIISIILNIMSFINRIISIRFLGIRPFCWIGCIGINCEANRYTPGCRRCRNRGISSFNAALDCFQIVLASALNVFEFDFYNDWINGALYPFLLKYKKKKRNEKYCGDGNGDEGNFIYNTNPPNGRVNDKEYHKIDEGVIVSYENELFYKPLTNVDQKFYATDIYNLGSIFTCDWQGQPKIVQDLPATSYQLPPLTSEAEDNITNLDGLLFDLTCLEPRANNTQSRSIRRICEVGVDLDEGENQNGAIDDGDINNALLRSNLILLNDPNASGEIVSNIDSGFGSSDYASYRAETVRGGNNDGGFHQWFGDSFYFYFGSKPNNTAIELMNGKYFTPCSKTIKNVITIIGVVTNVSTVDGSDGAIAIEINGGLPEYSFQWLDSNNQIVAGGDQQNISNLVEGSYSVVVTDANGVTGKKTFIVRGLQNLVATITTTNAQSSSIDNGSVIISSIVGGVGPYTINITTPEGNLIVEENIQYAYTLNDAGVGDYIILISDSQETPFTFPYVATVNVPSDLVIVGLESIGITCHDGDDGIISFTIEGGTPDYAITIVNELDDIISTSEITTGLPAGTYTISVEDSFGVQISADPITFVNPNDLILNYLGIFTGFRLDNSLNGVIYTIYKDDTPQAPTQTGDGGSIFFNNYSGTGSYIVTSEFGCPSNPIQL
jgi:hypothetical protein